MVNRNNIQVQALTTSEQEEGPLSDYALFVVVSFCLMSWLVFEVVTPWLRSL
ncbi:MAG: hypothetical protein OHK0056_10140 [Bacteriovoracaceae bacterium]